MIKTHANPHRALPPLDLLRGFESAARHLSFTRAAAELFLTQSAVSRQIQALELFLGTPLFERRHKALALTAAGQAYHRAVAPVLDQLREATRRARETRTGHVLTVTTTVSFASTSLAPRLSRFRHEEPARGLGRCTWWASPSRRSEARPTNAGRNGRANRSSIRRICATTCSSTCTIPPDAGRGSRGRRGWRRWAWRSSRPPGR